MLEMASVHPKRSAKSEALHRLGLDSDSENVSSDESTTTESESDGSTELESDETHEEDICEWNAVDADNDPFLILKGCLRLKDFLLLIQASTYPRMSRRV